MTVLKFIADDGRSVEIEPFNGERFEVEPLDFNQLIQAAESPSPSLPLVVKNGRAAKSETGLESEGPLTITTTWECRGKVLAYGLVKGGWLPMPWAHKRIAWIDQNVVIALEKLQAAEAAAGAPSGPGGLINWLGLDTETVSPLPFLIEGSQRKPPTEAEMREQWQRAAAALGKLLPGVKVQTICSLQMAALLQMLLDYSETRRRATQLLLRAAPLVQQHVKAGRRLALERTVLDLARQECVAPISLPVIALLSCVYDANPKASKHRAAMPGRTVLKPKVGYTSEDAYNALTDLFFVELLLNAQALFPESETVLYTRDVGIASLWTAMQSGPATVKHLPQGRVRTTVPFLLSNGLFPALSSLEVLELKKRLETAAELNGH